MPSSALRVWRWVDQPTKLDPSKTTVTSAGKTSGDLQCLLNPTPATQLFAYDVDDGEPPPSGCSTTRPLSAVAPSACARGQRGANLRAPKSGTQRLRLRIACAPLLLMRLRSHPPCVGRPLQRQRSQNARVETRRIGRAFEFFVLQRRAQGVELGFACSGARRNGCRLKSTCVFAENLGIWRARSRWMFWTRSLKAAPLTRHWIPAHLKGECPTDGAGIPGSGILDVAAQSGPGSACGVITKADRFSYGGLCADRGLWVVCGLRRLPPAAQELPSFSVAIGHSGFDRLTRAASPMFRLRTSPRSSCPLIDH